MIPYVREAIGAAAASALLFVLYEGLPFGALRDVPFIEHLVQGRVEAEREKAAAEAREGYVQEARLIAAQAQLFETRRQLAAGRKALDGYAELLREAQVREAELSEQDAKEDADYEARLAAEGRSCGLSADDLRFLMR